MKKFVCLLVGLLLFSTGFTACSSNDDEINSGMPLIGTKWVERTSTTLKTEVYTEDGVLLWSLFMLNDDGEISGQACGPANYYTLKGNTIHYFIASNGTKQEFNSATYTISGDQLTLTYADGTVSTFTGEPL